MKKTYLLTALNVFFLLVSGKALLAEEKIISFHADIIVYENALMRVTETIKVRAEGDRIKRGIYRDFPTRYKDRFGHNVVVGFKVLEILRDGEREDYHLQPQANGERIYIGSKNRFLNQGDHTYTIVYETNRQIGFFEDHDELYWNVTGNGWDFTIEKATARIELPLQAAENIIDYNVFTGGYGSQAKDAVVEKDLNGNVLFSTTHSLLSRQGMTVFVSWPADIVREPSLTERIVYFFQDNRVAFRGIVGLIFLFIYYIICWIIVGVDPEKGTVIPLFKPPADVSPAAARYILNMAYDDETFTASVIHLAVQGYIKIEENNKKYTISNTFKTPRNLSQEEEIILKILLNNKPSIDLKNTNHAVIRRAVSSFKKTLEQKCDIIYFFKNTKYLLPGLLITLAIVFFSGVLELESFEFYIVIIIFFAIFLGAAVRKFLRKLMDKVVRYVIMASVLGVGAVYCLQYGFASMLGLPEYRMSFILVFFLVLAVYINILFYYLLKAPTMKGRKLMDEIEGFKMYLSVAEKDRLNLLNPPDETPQLFEAYLPYAFALGVEQKWSERFSRVLENASYQPKWYCGSNWSYHRVGHFSSGLGSSLASTISSSSHAPGSSSGGRGFSGGGGGGGGGGGW